MSSYLLDLITLWAVFAVVATVIAELVEEAGFIHVGAAAFMGVGAYTVGLLSTQFNVNPQVSLVATIPVGALFGILIHFMVRRLRTDILALATLAVGVIGHGVLLNAVPITGGPMGLSGIPKRHPLVIHDSIDSLLLLIFVIVLLAIIRKNSFGLRIRALREDEILADDLELNPDHLRAAIWVVSSVIISLAGGFYAFILRYIDPSSFTVSESVTILAMALLIPSFRVFGASIGALVFIILPELLRFLGLPAGPGAEIRQMLFGIALLVVVTRTSVFKDARLITGANHA